MKVSKRDVKFIEGTLMPWAGVKKLMLAYSKSAAKWPDIWVSRNGVPKITVTDEWRRQSTHERRKRLTHEFLHLRGMRHGKVGKLDFNTIPSKDTYSKAIYQRIISEW